MVAGGRADWPTNCAESITAADAMIKLEFVSVAASKCGRAGAVPFLEGGLLKSGKRSYSNF
jgi:hypothetical protein